jgi:transposase InsO family protein
MRRMMKACGLRARSKRRFKATTKSAHDLPVAPSHKPASVRDRLEAIGATLHFLPPNSPGFNPLERRFLAAQGPAAKGRRTLRPGLVDLIRMLVAIFKPDECVNYLCSYGHNPA